MTSKQRAVSYLQVSDVRDTSSPEEVCLWRSVILQAIQDATLPDNPHFSPRLRTVARMWIFASVGVTLEDFEDVCGMAELDPSQVRDRTKYFIDNKIRLILRDDAIHT